MADKKQNQNKKQNKKQNKNKKDSEDTEQRRRTLLYIVLAVLAVLAAVLWYLYRQGYLQRWFPGVVARQRYDYSPSAPPFPATNGF